MFKIVSGLDRPIFEYVGCAPSPKTELNKRNEILLHAKSKFSIGSVDNEQSRIARIAKANTKHGAQMAMDWYSNKNCAHKLPKPHCSPLRKTRQVFYKKRGPLLLLPRFISEGRKLDASRFSKWFGPPKTEPKSKKSFFVL